MSVEQIRQMHHEFTERYREAGVSVVTINVGDTADEVKARGYNLDIKNPNTIAEDHGDPETLLGDLAAAEGETGKLRDQLKAILAEALAR